MALSAAGIQVEVHQTADVPDRATDALLGWVVREGITNVIRHSDSAHCTIRIDSVQQNLWLEVVDDEHGIRELLANALKKAGFDTRTAASGETALKMISQSPPKAILSDLMMPGGMSGFELIARMRSNPATEQIPIVVITGRDMTPEDRRFIIGEIADVIRKGDLLMSDLETRLRQTLEEIGVNPTSGKNIVD